MDQSASSPLLLRTLAFLAFAGVSTAACAADLDGSADVQSQDATKGANVSARAAAGKRICSWNIRRLGHGFDGLEKDMDLVQKVISANCDLVAVQEVMQMTADGATTVPGYDALVKEMGTTYWGSVRTEDARPVGTSSNSERYAWFWRKSAVSPCDGFTDARYIEDKENAFLREPAYACFKVKAHPREVVLATYHALYGSEPERKREVALLDDDLDDDGKTDDIFRTFRASRPGADVIMVGDFNLTPNQIKAALPTYADLVAGTGSTLSTTGAISPNQYDHVLVMPDEPLASKLAPAVTLDVRDIATSPRAFFQTVSDHLPIQLVLAD